jgi:hypothetical protein
LFSGGFGSGGGGGGSAVALVVGLATLFSLVKVALFKQPSKYAIQLSEVHNTII